MDARASSAKFFQAAIQPDGRSPRAANKFEIRLLHPGSAAEGDHGRLGLGGFGESGILDLPEKGFPFLLENLPDGRTLPSLNRGIYIDKRPTHVAGQQLSYRGLAAPHESQKVNELFAMTNHSIRCAVIFGGC